MPPSPSTSIPRPGMFAVVRKRHGVMTNVEPFDGDDGRRGQCGHQISAPRKRYTSYENERFLH